MVFLYGIFVWYFWYFCMVFLYGILWYFCMVFPELKLICAHFYAVALARSGHAGLDPFNELFAFKNYQAHGCESRRSGPFR